jgi:hypothetical protein
MASAHVPVLTAPGGVAPSDVGRTSGGASWPAGAGRGTGWGRGAPRAPWARSVIHVSWATWSISSASSSASVLHISPGLRADGGSRSSSTATRRVLTAGSSTSTP